MTDALAQTETWTTMASAPNAGLVSGTPRSGRFQIRRQLGSGGMGVVFEAFDPELQRRVALKLVRAGGRLEHSATLLREARAMAQLAHPSVVQVFEVGAFDDGVFIAMELVEDGTLRDWLRAGRRPWRVVLAQLVDAGRGLAAAHASGIVHRDFKPENVLIGRDGRARVSDFGLARRGADTVPPASGAPHVASVSVTQSLGGTPGYLAPEALDGVVDARGDQFAFCVTLHEALYGVGPFEVRVEDGDDPLRRGVEAARRGVLRAPPPDRDVPAWLRKIIARGLAADPGARWPSMSVLLDELERVPQRRRRRRALTAVAIAAVTVALGVYAATWLAGARERDRRVAQHVEAARDHEAHAQTLAAEAEQLRATALATFDAGNKEGGEVVWSDALARSADADLARVDATQELEAALIVDAGRVDVRDRLAAVLHARALDAERWRRPLDELRRRVATHDRTGAYARAWDAPAALEVRPPDGKAATVELLRFDDVDGVRVPVAVDGPKAAPARWDGLPRGSYLVRATVDGRAFPAPVLLARGAAVTLALPVPPAEVPDGFVYVLAGDVLYGSRATEELRRIFFYTSPQHPRRVEAFLAARHETTFADWIEYLEALPPEERARRRPVSGTLHRGLIDLQDTPDGWRLFLQPTTQPYIARAGESIVYPGRRVRARQDWLRMPVVGVSFEDARAYVAWLDETGRVPGARLCTPLEWERMARGADDRLFPHGDVVRPTDANFDETYGRDPLGYGPDEVGSHPASASVFGVQDLVGNAIEWIDAPDGRNIRGGSFYIASLVTRIENTEPTEPTIRLITVGLRVCADVR